MRQIDDPVRLRRRAANLERGPGRRVHPGVLARHIGGSSVCTSSPLRVRPGHRVAGTGSSNPFPSSEESNANLTQSPAADPGLIPDLLLAPGRHRKPWKQTFQANASSDPRAARVREPCLAFRSWKRRCRDPTMEIIFAARRLKVMSDFDHGLDLSHLTVWPPQPSTLAGIGLIALAIFQPELAIPALITGLIAIIGDDKTHLDRKPPEPE